MNCYQDSLVEKTANEYQLEKKCIEKLFSKTVRLLAPKYFSFRTYVFIFAFSLSQYISAALTKIQ